MKFFLLITFTSQYSQGLFQPFVKTFIEFGHNPWHYYMQHNFNVDAFPYHPLMLYLLTLFYYPVTLLDIENIYLVNFFFKLPLFLSDILILYILVKFLKGYYLRIIIFYFANPIILYAIYIHSQLDIIPTALLLYALYMLTEKKIKISALILGLAMSTKFHLLLVIPLAFIYIYKNYSFKRALLYTSITISTFLLLDIPYLFDSGFFQMVLANQKQSLLFDSYYNIGELKIYLPLFSVITILSHFINQRKVNMDLLFFYFGILYTAIIFFVSPSPAWYVWIVPFVSIYFIQSGQIYRSLFLYTAFSLSYVIFFVFFHQDSYVDIIFMTHVVDFKIHNDQLMNISFTLLESIVAITLFTFYKYGIRSNSVYKKNTNTVIGIGGDSGVGKSMLLGDMAKLLGGRLLQLEGDGEHKWERGHNKWESFTHLDPKANYIHNQSNAIFELKHNNTIKRSNYDHSEGKFTAPVTLKPNEFISLSGLHPFYLPSMRKNIDLKIYVDTDEKLRRHWKVLRDTSYRGYSIAKSIEQIERRVNDTHKYIYPQKKFADIIIRYFPLDSFEIGNNTETLELGLKIVFNANICIENLLRHFSTDFRWDYNEDLQSQYIEFSSEPKCDFSILAIENISNIDEILDNNYTWLTGYRGFVQLIIILSLSETMKRGG